MSTTTDHLKPPKSQPSRKIKKGELKNIRKMMRHRIWAGQAHSGSGMTDGVFEYHTQQQDRDQFGLSEDLLGKTVRVTVKKVKIKKKFQID